MSSTISYLSAYRQDISDAFGSSPVKNDNGEIVLQTPTTHIIIKNGCIVLIEHTSRITGITWSFDKGLNDINRLYTDHIIRVTLSLMQV